MPGEGGIIACTWPRGGQEALALGNQHFAGYLNECQPGYEWAATSLYMWQHMPYRSLAHTRIMCERYDGAKRNPFNEVEWGSHYSRSMASYGVFTAACGFEYDGPRDHIGFAPKIQQDNFRAAFTSAAGWGTFSQQRAAGMQSESIAVRYGALTVRTLAFELPDGMKAKNISVTVHTSGAAQAAAPRDLPAKFNQRGARVEITLDAPAEVVAGGELHVTVR